MEDKRTEALPIPAKRSPKDSIGWIGFAVTAALLLHLIYFHGTNLWYYCFGAGRQILGLLFSSELTGPVQAAAILSVLESALLLVYPALLLVLMPLRKRFVPTMLIVLAIAAIGLNIAGQVAAVLITAQYGNAIVIRWASVLWLALEAALLVFYLTSKRFRAIFTK